MKRLLIAALVFTISLLVQNITAYAKTLLILESPTISSDGDGYGGHNWNNMTTAIDTATGNNVDVVSNFNNLDQMLGYDALWIDRRSAGYPRSDLLSASEVSNITAFINTGKPVVMIGEWWMDDWNNQLLGIVGGSFDGSSFEGITSTAISNSLTDGVNQVYVASAGVVSDGISLFENNFATLWGNNVLTVLDVGIFGDDSWATSNNSQFATNVANWIATLVTVPKPTISVTPLSHDFGEVEFENSRVTIFTISNTGEDDLTIAGIDFQAGSSADFSVTAIPPLPKTLAPSESVDVQITFTPSATGVVSAVLAIASNDPDSPIVEVEFAGEGIIVEIPPSEQIADIINFFDAAVKAGTLDGTRSRAPLKKINQKLFRSMLLTAKILIDGDHTKLACLFLNGAYLSSDGIRRPLDLVEGSDCAELNGMIQNLIADMGCK